MIIGFIMICLEDSTLPPKKTWRDVVALRRREPLTSHDKLTSTSVSRCRAISLFCFHLRSWEAHKSNRSLEDIRLTYSENLNSLRGWSWLLEANLAACIAVLTVNIITIHNALILRLIFSMIQHRRTEHHGSCSPVPTCVA